jgi:predicted RNase H-like HicB family nuclease
MPRYPIVIEKGDRNYSAYAPDVPGCVAVGSTVDETKQHMADALTFHFESLRLDGEPIPEPSESVTYVEV